MSLHEWTLGGLDLVKPEPLPAAGYWFETKSGGWDLGMAGAEKIIRPSSVRDGDDSVIDRYTNKDVVFRVAVASRDTGGIAQGEKALALQVNGRPNTLRWVPPDGVGFPTRFAVRTSWMRYLSDDYKLAQDGVKYAIYEVHLDCEPWNYSDTERAETFTRSSGSPTVVDNCSSAAAWPGLTAGTYLTQSVVSTGYLGGTSGNNSNQVEIPRTGSITSANYLYADIAVEGGNLGSPPVLVGPGEIKHLVAALPQTLGFTRYVFAMGQAMPFFLRTGLAVGDPAGPGAKIHINEVGTMSSLPSSSLLALTMEGSVSVDARLRISLLGKFATIVYSDPSMLANGWDPKERLTWETAPEGEYMLWVKLTAGTPVDGDKVEVTFHGLTRSTITQAGFRWLPVGPFPLGGRRDRTIGAPGTEIGAPVVKLQGVTRTADVRLFRDTSRDNDAALTVLQEISGAGNLTLFIDPPSLDQPFPGIFAGTATDGSNAVSVIEKADAWAWQRMVPGVTGLFVECWSTASAQISNPTVDAVHRLAFHTFAAAA